MRFDEPGPIKGVHRWHTPDGILVVRIHYTADDDKDPANPAGQQWLKKSLIGKPGGMKGDAWQKEMEIDFTLFSGKPVVPQFNEMVHVAQQPLLPVQGVPIIRGWDAGLTPACAFSQLTHTPKWLIFPCLHTKDREAVGMVRFSQEVVEYSNQTYPGFTFLDYGDPAMMSSSQVDERTCAQILAGHNITLIPGEIGSKSRDNLLRAQFERMVNGEPFVQVCPTAHFMRLGFKGGFKHKEIGNTGIYLPEHDKNEYSHPFEALQYAASRMFSMVNPTGKGRSTPKSGGFSNWDRRRSSD